MTPPCAAKRNRHGIFVEPGSETERVGKPETETRAGEDRIVDTPRISSQTQTEGTDRQGVRRFRR
jgi:hypothetical protein